MMITVMMTTMMEGRGRDIHLAAAAAIARMRVRIQTTAFERNDR